MESFEEIEEVYKRLEGKLSQEEFKSKVDIKFKEMNELCDYKTAAMIVASELGVTETINIKQGQTIKVKGYIKGGKLGLEVNVGRGGSIEHIEKEVSVNIKPLKINEIKNGMNGLN